MSLNYNLWFAKNGLLASLTGKRAYEEDIDWVLHAKDRVLSPAAVAAAVASYRTRCIAFVDTVPAADPPLPSPCDL